MNPFLAGAFIGGAWALAVSYPDSSVGAGLMAAAAVIKAGTFQVIHRPKG